MRVLVWKKAPADRRSVTPRTRSSSQSRPATSRVGSPDVTSARPSLTACSRPDQLGVGARRAARPGGRPPPRPPARSPRSPAPGPSRRPRAPPRGAARPPGRAGRRGAIPSAVRPRAHRLAHRVAERRREQAVPARRSPRPSARGRGSRGATPPSGAGRRRVLHLVAVAEALDRRVGRADVDALQVADPREVLRHLVALGGERAARTRRAAGGSRRTAARRGTAPPPGRGRGASTSSRSASAKRRRALRIRTRARSPGAVSRAKTTNPSWRATPAPPNARSWTSSSRTSSRRGRCGGWSSWA